MKPVIWLGLMGAMLLGAVVSADQQPRAAVRHVVVFKYKPTATPAQMAQVTAAFRGLKGKIPGIVTFESVAARDAYLPHPDHKAFGDLLTRLDVVENIFVVDFTSEP